MNYATEKCPDMILLTQCYYHRGPLVFATYDPTGMLRRSTCVQFFSFENLQNVKHMYNDISVSLRSHRNELHNSPVARDSAAAGAVCPTYK